MGLELFESLCEFRELDGYEPHVLREIALAVLYARYGIFSYHVVIMGLNWHYEVVDCDDIDFWKAVAQGVAAVLALADYAILDGEGGVEDHSVTEVILRFELNFYGDVFAAVGLALDVEDCAAGVFPQALVFAVGEVDLGDLLLGKDGLQEKQKGSSLPFLPKIVLAA